ncbi:NAD(P)H-hydrate dehydratase [Salegentibacter sediminis]|uniref:NAD(P)H-hydrate dehydratase n=1 Tax=Salegentibacter sediminis TaxID=1930251 RepID=UPI0009C0C945|nr:NAD(P)H-hydrate dehydratase [Salegentibacter sediminis]
MKIYSAEQLQKADSISVKNQNITSTELMERAAGMVFNQIHSRLEASDIVVKIFCGIGNNGGDGLVIARMLVEHGYEVKVFVVNYSDKRSKDFLINYDRFKNTTKDWPVLIKNQNDFPKIDEGDFVIDAMFGIGLNRPIEGWVGALVAHINKSGAFILAIDMPSGLYAEKIPESKSAIINANFTLTFQSPKFTFFLPQTMDNVGDFQVLDIGLDKEFLAKTNTSARLIGKEEARLLYKNRKKNSHKGDYGHSLIIGGSYGKIGSIVLSATAALKTGAGLCSVFSPECGYEIIQTALPEAMVITDKQKKHLSEIKIDFEPDVLCFGMGAGTGDEASSAFQKLLKETKKPMLIDADGLNMLAKNKELLDLVPERSVLTPHPKELERLIGKWDDDLHKIKKVQKFIKKYNVILVLKGAHSFCFSKEEIFINNSGNPGMATAGAGDVLSGVISGLMSQKYDPVIAVVLGVYLHGLAGDLAAEKMGYEAITAREIINNLGGAFFELFTEEEDLHFD